MRPLLLLTAASLLALPSARAQEPAYYQGRQAVRFQEAPDRYHYIFPCSAFANSMPTSAAPAGLPSEQALCWAAVSTTFRVIEGKLQPNATLAGTLQISPHYVRFYPDTGLDQSGYFELPPAQTTFSSVQEKQFILLSNGKDFVYRLALRSACLACTPDGSTFELPPSPQLNTELSLVGQIIHNYSAASRPLLSIIALFRVGVSPKNQPSLTDPPEAMALYSTLNRRLMPLCTPAAQSCIGKYVDYQACKAASLSAPCGEPPACSTFCGLSSQSLQSLHSLFCTAKTEDSMSVTPDWSAVATKMEQARQARGPLDPATLKFEKAPPGPPLDFMGKPIQPGCTVESSYATAMMFATGPKSPPVAGVAGLSSIMDGASAAALINPAIMAGRIVSKTAPVYPPIARAARVSGAVVLKASISPGGDVTELNVVSGPEMLRSAALDAVKTWKYEPYLVAGKPVPVQTFITVNFNFGGDPADSPPATPPPPP